MGVPVGMSNNEATQVSSKMSLRTTCEQSAPVVSSAGRMPLQCVPSARMQVPAVQVTDINSANTATSISQTWECAESSTNSSAVTTISSMAYMVPPQTTPTLTQCITSPSIYNWGNTLLSERAATGMSNSKAESVCVVGDDGVQQELVTRVADLIQQTQPHSTMLHNPGLAVNTDDSIPLTPATTPLPGSPVSAVSSNPLVNCTDLNNGEEVNVQTSGLPALKSASSAVPVMFTNVNGNIVPLSTTPIVQVFVVNNSCQGSNCPSVTATPSRHQSNRGAVAHQRLCPIAPAPIQGQISLAQTGADVSRAGCETI
jgi:hypothetical protein